MKVPLFLFFEYQTAILAPSARIESAVSKLRGRAQDDRSRAALPMGWGRRLLIGSLDLSHVNRLLRVACSASCCSLAGLTRLLGLLGISGGCCSSVVVLREISSAFAAQVSFFRQGTHLCGNRQQKMGDYQTERPTGRSPQWPQPLDSYIEVMLVQGYLHVAESFRKAPPIVIDQQLLVIKSIFSL